MSNEINVELETITPTIAEKYLALNIENNRRVKRGHVDTLAEAMTSGDWLQTGDTIKFQRPNGDGIEHLIDGQHRLQAIIRLGKPVKMFVARGLEPKTFLTIDQGAKRTAADALSMAGYHQSTMLAAAARLFVSWALDHTFSWSTHKKITNGIILDTVENHKSLTTSCMIGHKARFIIPGSQLVFLHYVTSRENPDLALEFCTKLTEGISMMKGDPILTFRERIFKYKGFNTRPSKQLQLAMLFKTWNYFYNGERVEKLRFAKDEAFPILAGVDRKRITGVDYPTPEEMAEREKDKTTRRNTAKKGADRQGNLF